MQGEMVEVWPWFEVVHNNTEWDNRSKDRLAVTELDNMSLVVDTHRDSVDNHKDLVADNRKRVGNSRMAMEGVMATVYEFSVQRHPGVGLLG